MRDYWFANPVNFQNLIIFKRKLFEDYPDTASTV